jgi:hypothetical protein
VNIFTIAKRVANKVRPVDASIRETGCVKQEGISNWKQKCLDRKALLPPGNGPFDDRYLTKKFSTIPRRSRLTLERKSTIQIGYKLQPREEELFFEMLSNREAALL